MPRRDGSRLVHGCGPVPTQGPLQGRKRQAHYETDQNHTKEQARRNRGPPRHCGGGGAFWNFCPHDFLPVSRPSLKDVVVAMVERRCRSCTVVLLLSVESSSPSEWIVEKERAHTPAPHSFGMSARAFTFRVGRARRGP